MCGCQRVRTPPEVTPKEVVPELTEVARVGVGLAATRIDMGETNAYPSVVKELPIEDAIRPRTGILL